MKVDWSKLVLRLSAKSGKKLATIARELDIDTQHITRLARNDVQEPKWTTGLKLLDCYHDLFDGDMSELRG